MKALLLPVQTTVLFLAKRKLSTLSPDEDTQYGSRNVAINKRLITLTPASWYKQLNVYLPEKKTMSNSIFISSITVFFFTSWNPALIILITSLSFSPNIRKTPFCPSCHQCVYNRLFFVSVCTQFFFFFFFENERFAVIMVRLKSLRTVQNILIANLGFSQCTHKNF